MTGADGTISKFFVSSGTVNVHADSSVQLLAEEACLLSDIDVSNMGSVFLLESGGRDVY